MIRAKFQLEAVRSIEATMEITMTVGEWEGLEKQLVSSYPSWKLSRAITKLLGQASKVFYAKTEVKED